MQLALRRPELLRALVVVDIAPVEYPVKGGRTDDPDEEASPFAAYIDAMRAMDLDALETRDDADAALRDRRPEPDGAQLPAAEPRAGGVGRRRRLALAAQPRTAGARPRRAARLPRAARPGRRSTGRCCGSPGANSPTCCPRTGRTWTRCSPPPGWSGSRTPATGCTREQPEIFLETLRRFLDARRGLTARPRRQSRDRRRNAATASGAKIAVSSERPGDRDRDGVLQRPGGVRRCRRAVAPELPARLGHRGDRVPLGDGPQPRRHALRRRERVGDERQREHHREHEALHGLDRPHQRADPDAQPDQGEPEEQQQEERRARRPRSRCGSASR